MKLIPLMILCLLITSLLQAYCPECTLTIKPQWKHLSSPDIHSDTILVADILFKKKSNESVKLETLTLQWHGATIDHICGSLYYHNPKRVFKAIEENVVCDSMWHNKKQQLTLPLKEKKGLAVSDTFSLVLTIPKTLLPLLTGGFFTIVNETLPTPFQKSTDNQKLFIAPADKTIAPTPPLCINILKNEPIF